MCSPTSVRVGESATKKASNECVLSTKSSVKEFVKSNSSIALRASKNSIRFIDSKERIFYSNSPNASHRRNSPTPKSLTSSNSSKVTLNSKCVSNKKKDSLSSAVTNVSTLDTSITKSSIKGDRSPSSIRSYKDSSLRFRAYDNVTRRKRGLSPSPSRKEKITPKLRPDKISYVQKVKPNSSKVSVVDKALKPSSEKTRAKCVNTFPRFITKEEKLKQNAPDNSTKKSNPPKPKSAETKRYIIYKPNAKQVQKVNENESGKTDKPQLKSQFSGIFKNKDYAGRKEERTKCTATEAKLSEEKRTTSGPSKLRINEIISECPSEVFMEEIHDFSGKSSWTSDSSKHNNRIVSDKSEIRVRDTISSFMLENKFSPKIVHDTQSFNIEQETKRGSSLFYIEFNKTPLDPYSDQKLPRTYSVNSHESSCSKKSMFPYRIPYGQEPCPDESSAMMTKVSSPYTEEYTKSLQKEACPEYVEQPQHFSNTDYVEEAQPLSYPDYVQQPLSYPDYVDQEPHLSYPDYVEQAQPSSYPDYVQQAQPSSYPDYVEQVQSSPYPDYAEQGQPFSHPDYAEDQHLSYPDYAEQPQHLSYPDCEQQEQHFSNSDYLQQPQNFTRSSENEQELPYTPIADDSLYKEPDMSMNKNQDCPYYEDDIKYSNIPEASGETYKEAELGKHEEKTEFEKQEAPLPPEKQEVPLESDNQQSFSDKPEKEKSHGKKKNKKHKNPIVGNFVTHAGKFLNIRKAGCGVHSPVSTRNKSVNSKIGWFFKYITSIKDNKLCINFFRVS